MAYKSLKSGRILINMNSMTSKFVSLNGYLYWCEPKPSNTWMCISLQNILLLLFESCSVKQRLIGREFWNKFQEQVISKFLAKLYNTSYISVLEMCCSFCTISRPRSKLPYNLFEDGYIYLDLKLFKDYKGWPKW